jgi:uncharacterized glyoxalase superfamily protein PhnB
MKELLLDVAVDDVPAAVAFYCALFHGISQGEDPSGGHRVRLGGAVVLRVKDDRTHVPARSDPCFYEKGRTPRLETRVDDVPAAVEHALAAGAILCGRVPIGDSEGPVRYAQIIDPFGHLWSLARTLETDHRD